MTYAALAVAALVTARGPVPYEPEIDAALAATATIYRVPKALVVAVMFVESGFHPRAISPAGAKGLMQLMPYTARRVGVPEQDLFDPAKNILGGVRLLSVLLQHYDGDVVSALTAYNARPRRLFAPIPRNGETPAYVWRVLANARQVLRSGAPCGPNCRVRTVGPQARDKWSGPASRDDVRSRGFLREMRRLLRPDSLPDRAEGARESACRRSVARKPS